MAQHPSETMPYLLCRSLAYALSYQDGLEFSPQGLGDPDAPALRALGTHGETRLWIEIGNPSARKLHKASKVARQVIVYTYKDADVLVEDIKTNQVHRANDLHIYAFEPKFLAALEKHVTKNNRWSVLVQQGRLDIGLPDSSLATDLQRIELKQ